jgi:hypothetical protein
MYLHCDKCEVTFNAPFCPVCEVPYIGADAYVPRFDGIDAADRVQAHTEAHRAKRGADPDTYDILSNPSFNA